MARYARRSHKGRRGNRTLSTRRIFNNKGAKAQAAQINALKKRINRVYRRTKPEYKLLRTDTENRAFGVDVNTGPTFLTNFSIQPASTPAEGTGDNQRIGNKISMSALNMFMNIRYMHDNEIISNVYPYAQHPIQTTGMILRFVAVQAIAAESSAPTVTELFQQAYVGSDQQAADSMMMMTMPFKNGITAKYRILKDKRITANEDKPIYARRFKVKPAIRTLRWEDGKQYPAGQIWYVLLSAGADIRAVTNDGVTYYNYNYLDTTWRTELVYTDV